MMPAIYHSLRRLTRGCRTPRPARHWYNDDQPFGTRGDMSWALNEFFAGVEDEFGVPIGEADDAFLETPGAVIDFVVENTEPSDGMDAEEHREHVAGVIGEIMARTLGITRYSENSRFVQDLHVR
jgi:hypothetical protein